MEIGFIGLGVMGGRMATRLVAHGHSLVVHDISPIASQALVEKGALARQSPHEVVEARETILLSLPGPPEVRAVVRDLVPSLKAGTLVLDLSTCAPSTAKELAPLVSGRGAHFVDSPVTGGSVGSENGTLRAMVGATPELMPRVRSVLEPLTAEVLAMGPSGAGYAAKLAHNFFSLMSVPALLEALLLARAGGVEMTAMLSLLRARALIAPEGDRREIRFRTALAAKDIRLGTELADDEGSPFAMGHGAADLLAEGVAAGFGDKDLVDFVELMFARRAGASLGVSPKFG